MTPHLLRRFLILGILSIVAISLLLIQSAPARAGTDNISSPQRELAQQGPVQYAVKFICGRSSGLIVAPGIYYTAINVHNPSKDLAFRKRLSLPGAEAETPGEVGKTFGAKLGTDQSLEIDCPDILKLAPTQPKDGFLKGFVVIESEFELDVVAVYTAGSLLTRGQLVTMEIERVPARHIQQ